MTLILSDDCPVDIKMPDADLLSPGASDNPNSLSFGLLLKNGQLFSSGY